MVKENLRTKTLRVPNNERIQYTYLNQAMRENNRPVPSGGSGVQSNPLFKLNFKCAHTSRVSLKIILVHVHELARSRESLAKQKRSVFS